MACWSIRRCYAVYWTMVIRSMLQVINMIWFSRRPLSTQYLMYYLLRHTKMCRLWRGALKIRQYRKERGHTAKLMDQWYCCQKRQQLGKKTRKFNVQIVWSYNSLVVIYWLIITIYCLRTIKKYAKFVKTGE